MKKTPWFSANVRPVREGIYETKCIHGYGHPDNRFRWEGGRWWWPDGEQSTFGFIGSGVCDYWRGLAERP